MVLRVCSVLLRNPHDAHDVFQATFLVLLRKAHTIWIRDSLGPWLHRVAKRLAVQVQASARRRRAFELRAAESRGAPSGVAPGRDGGWTVLHEEIDRLPERYRIPVILCHLEGQSQELAARALKLPVGTVKSRLHRARDILRARLARRGAAFSAALLTADLSSSARAAAVSSLISPSLIGAAIRSGMTRAGESGLISLRTVQLVEEAIKSMFLTSIRNGVALVLLTGCLAIGAAGVFAQQGPPQQTGRELKQGSNDPARAGAASGEPAPRYIRQSRKMIVERLEQEVTLARERADRTSRKVQSSTDPELLRARKIADRIAGLLARIDDVLVDAVDEFPTMFDFTSSETGGPSRQSVADQFAKAPATASSKYDIKNSNPASRSRAAAAQSGPGPAPSPAYPTAGPAYDEHSLARAAEKLQWSGRMLEKGYVTKSQHDAERHLYESLKARIEADIARAQDRVEWARRMHEKGYVSKKQYDAEILKHYDALKARMEGPAVSDELRARYDDLKRQYETKPSDASQSNTPGAPAAKPADASQSNRPGAPAAKPSDAPSP
jgi:RNA polymerase sigma factor (sigma-70 family)